MGLSGNLQKTSLGFTAQMPGKLVFGVPGPKGDPGLSDAAKLLLISILQEGDYRTDQTARIRALALEMGVGMDENITAILGVAILGELVLGG